MNQPLQATLPSGSVRLPIDSLFNDEEEPTYPILVIEDYRGVIYNAQIGGMACNQTEFQGIPIMLRNFDKDYVFELHNHLCCNWHDKETIAARKMLADKFDTLSHGFELEMKFDYDRIDELQEGCIPVVLNGVYDKFGAEYDCNGKIGMIFTGNCD